MPGPAKPGPRSGIARQGNDRLIVGRLAAFGPAPYQFREGEAGSYFVQLLTDRGERTLWGKDLERALRQSATQPKRGEIVGARRIGREAVTIVAQERDADGRVVSRAEHLAHRNRWVVEKVRFFAERSRLAHQVRDRQLDARQTVKEHPELASTFLSLRGAQELAERRIADPKERERFVSLVREAIAGSIQKGQPLLTVKLREVSRESRTPERPHSPDNKRSR